MKIKKITIENFRGFSGKTTIDFGQLNVFIGKNDAGKSTILEALDIFFNDSKTGYTKIDVKDKSKGCRDDDIISIKVSFLGYPEEVNIDSGNITSLKDEHLLNNELLEIKKTYVGKTLKASAYIIANHPTCEIGKDLLLKKNAELKKIVKENEWNSANDTKNAELRKTIWQNCGELNKQEIEIQADKVDAKDFWANLEKLLPAYSLFQSDRKNQEDDDEAQDPITEAVKHVLEDTELQKKLDSVAETVKKEIEEVLNNTVKKLGEMNPEIAKTLKPNIPKTSDLKWDSVFKKIGIDSDGVPLNKRGSGVKRLVLLNFFMAAAEKKQQEAKKNNIIYAMEEPETAQHPKHQKILIETFESLSQNCQILLTTHSPLIVQLLAKGSHNLNLIKKEDEEKFIPIDEKLLSQNKIALKYESGHISGNEISFLAFDHISAEFHTELYSFIQSKEKDIFEKKINTPNEHAPTKKYNERSGDKEVTSHKYIRDQIHHPENKKNKPYEQDELRESIEKMRKYLLKPSE